MQTRSQNAKTPGTLRLRGLHDEILAVTYSGMPERHTTIGAERFHFRVRNGIGWFPLAMAARQTCRGSSRWTFSGPPRRASNPVSFLFRRLSRSTSSMDHSIVLHQTLKLKPLEVIWSSLTGN